MLSFFFFFTLEGGAPSVCDGTGERREKGVKGHTRLAHLNAVRCNLRVVQEVRVLLMEGMDLQDHNIRSQEQMN